MIKQEFLNGRITLYKGDCLEVMQEMKDLACKRIETELKQSDLF